MTRDQFFLHGFHSFTVTASNTDQAQPIYEMFTKVDTEDYFNANSIVSCYHIRGSDELANRALKDFVHE